MPIGGYIPNTHLRIETDRHGTTRTIRMNDRPEERKLQERRMTIDNAIRSGEFSGDRLNILLEEREAIIQTISLMDSL